MDNFTVYKDIKARTNGEIYIGVVGPVRTGKSTFIKRFMDLLVIPKIEDVHSKERAIDELPQSATGKTIMTTEPKFIPKEAANISLADGANAKVRLIDCVGYMVDGAVGHIENEEERMVHTPWFDYDIPFTKAAEIGTKKVIREHSTVGIVITTDGSFGEIPRESYLDGEQRTIRELQDIGKPFIVILNTVRPYDTATKELCKNMEQNYGVVVLPMNIEQLKTEDINSIMETILSAFPISQMKFFFPKWAEMLPKDHWLKRELIDKVMDFIKRLKYMRDIGSQDLSIPSDYVVSVGTNKISMEDGTVEFGVNLDDKYYYQILSDLVGVEISGEYQLISLMRDLAAKRNEYETIADACLSVKQKGYGVVTPTMEEIQIKEPEVIKHGNKYGVKIKALSPSIHLIQANIETEIAPIVGTEDQANDLIRYINGNTSTNPNGIWDTNIFGKSIRELVEDGIQTKVSRLSDESQIKLQDTIQKVVNDSNGGLVCIII